MFFENWHIGFPFPIPRQAMHCKQKQGVSYIFTTLIEVGTFCFYLYHDLNIFPNTYFVDLKDVCGWSGGAMVLGKLSGPGRSTV